MMHEPISTLFDSSSMISPNTNSEAGSGFTCRKAVVTAFIAVLSCCAFSYNSFLCTFREDAATTSMQTTVHPFNPKSLKRVSLTLGLYEDTFVSNKVRKGTRAAKRRLNRPSPNQRFEKGDGKKSKSNKYFDAYASYRYTVDDHYTDDYGPAHDSYGLKSSKKGKDPKHKKDAYTDSIEKSVPVDDRYTDDVEPIIMGSDNSGSDDRYFGSEKGPNDTEKVNQYMGPNENQITNVDGSDNRYFGNEDNSPSDTQVVNGEPNENKPVPSNVKPTKIPTTSSSKVSMTNSSSSKTPSQVPAIVSGRKPNKPILKKPTTTGDSPQEGFPSPILSNTNTDPTNTITASITSTPTVTKPPSIPSKVKAVPTMEPTLAPTTKANMTGQDVQTWPTSSPTALPTPNAETNITGTDDPIWSTASPTAMPTIEVISSTTQVNNSTNNSSLETNGEIIVNVTTSTNTEPSSLQSSTETVSLTNGEENQSPSGSSRKALFVAFASYGAGLIFAVGLIGFSIIQHQRMRRGTEEEI